MSKSSREKITSFSFDAASMLGKFLELVSDLVLSPLPGNEPGFSLRMFPFKKQYLLSVHSGLKLNTVAD